MRSAAQRQVRRNRRGHGDVFFLARQTRKARRLRCTSSCERNGLEVELHQAGLGFGDVHQRVQHRQHAVAFLHRIEQRVAAFLRVGLAFERELGGAAKAGQRRAQIVRDIVQRLAHAADERVVFLQHRVEESREVADLVVRFRQRHALVHAPGRDDILHRADELADRRERPPRKPRSAGDAKQERDERDPAEDRAKFR